MNIILRSSSGSTLAKGDTETELSLQVYYGQQQINTDDSTKDFFYVWKKDGVALSSFFEKVIVQKENEEGELVLQEELREIVRPDIFNRKKIIVKASDFNLKSDYSCYVYTSLENKVGDLEVNSAIEDYKQKNENEEVDLTSSAIPLFIIKQPENHAVMEGEQWSTTVITKGYNLKYQWYYKDKEMDAFEASDIKTNVYSTLLTKESIGRVIYCTITGTNLEGTNSYSINTNEILFHSCDLNG